VLRRVAQYRRGIMVSHDQSDGSVLDVARMFARARCGNDSNIAFDKLVRHLTAHLDLKGASVSLLRNNLLRPVVTSSPSLEVIERLQEERQSGPGAEVVRHGRSIVLPRLDEHRHRWPDYIACARRSGIESIAVLPLAAAERRLGCVAMYRRSPRVWRREELITAAGVAELAVGHLTVTAELESRDRLIAQLEGALDSRIIIEQAKGIIAAKRSVSIDDAFQILRNYSRDRNSSLRLVAAAVVKLGLLP
jgi:ANTAR domain/GAF domain